VASEALSSVLLGGQAAQRLTAGRFNIAAAPLCKLWHDPQRLSWPTVEEIAVARASCVATAVQQSSLGFRLTPGTTIELGGVGKEWCVDQLLNQLVAAGVEDVVIELGGDCAAHGRQPNHSGWTVLLPGVAAAITLCNEAIATSGVGTRGRWLVGHWITHVLDAVTGLPASGHVRSASVIAKSCQQAGIRATDLCLLTDDSPLMMLARSGGLPLWLRKGDGSWWADHQLAARLSPVTHTTRVNANTAA
jgi:thiamine biosynthesis lipoprotein